MKQFISVKDVPSIKELIDLSLRYKANPMTDQNLGSGKRIGLLFFNPSMRTRLSTQIAAKNLGLDAIVLNVGQEGWALEFGEGTVMNGTTVEHIKDAAPVLGAYFDILCLRSFPGLKSLAEDESETPIRSLIKYSGRPVVSLESNLLHPLQSLADLVTMTEVLKSKNMKRKPKVVLTWAPHVKAIPQCVANSFAEWTNAWGEADFVITHPKGYELQSQFCGEAPVVYDQAQALEGADFVYVKNWSSVNEYGQILGSHPDWMLTENSLKNAPLAKVMHCLPLRRNLELSDEVLDSSRSLLTQQATNRIYSAQSVLSKILSS
jgi:N-succinyl-L-ornithine transcarbamylase